RIEAMRAGIRIRTSSAIVVALYGLPETRNTGDLCAAAGVPSVQPVRPLRKSRFAMDSFELNKVLGAVLATCLALLSLNIAAGAIFTAHKPEKPGYEIAGKEDDSHGKPGEAAPAEEPLPVRFASAARGRRD